MMSGTALGLRVVWWKGFSRSGMLMWLAASIARSARAVAPSPPSCEMHTQSVSQCPPSLQNPQAGCL